MATIRGKVGDWATLAIDLLYAHLDASFIVNHLETTNAVQTSPLQPRRAKKRVYNSFDLNCLRHMARFVTTRRHTTSVGSTVRVQQRNDKCVTSVRQCVPFHRLDWQAAGVPQNALDKPTPI
jgi:hypothetical protein